MCAPVAANGAHIRTYPSSTYPCSTAGGSLRKCRLNRRQLIIWDHKIVFILLFETKKMYYGLQLLNYVYTIA